MDIQAYEAGYDLTYGLLEMIWGAWDVLRPMILIFLVMGFVLWIWRKSRGKSMDDGEVNRV
jgi:hypothetical protein